MTTFSITTPIFYVNGPPHIGHAYAVIAADVLARFHRQRGADVFFLTGTDEHGAKIAEAAAAAGKDPQVFTDEIAESFRHAWKALDIQNDDFIRTTEPRHESGVKQALQELHDRKLLYQKSYHGLYCTGCERFLTERDLDTEGKCPLHNRTPVEIEEQNWFFKLTEFLPQIKEAIESNQLKIVPEERRNEVLGLLNQDLEDFSVSRLRERVPWGIPLPFDGSQTVYVWVDALLNYLTSLGYGSEDESRLEKYWPVDAHLIGQDILKFHAVYWPALLLALGKELPKSIVVHGFFTVDGRKISKSLGNAIDPLQLVQRYGSDAARFLLLSQFPFGASGDVRTERFDELYDAHLANNLGNLVRRTISLLQKFSESKIPSVKPDRTQIRRVEAYRRIVNQRVSADFALGIEAIVRAPTELSGVLTEVTNEASFWQYFTSWISGFGVREVRNVTTSLSASLNDYIEKETLYRNPDFAKLRALAEGAIELGYLLKPLLPRTSTAIQRAFGISDTQSREKVEFVKPTEPAILFPRAETLPR